MSFSVYRTFRLISTSPCGPSVAVTFVAFTLSQTLSIFPSTAGPSATFLATISTCAMAGLAAIAAANVNSLRIRPIQRLIVRSFPVTHPVAAPHLSLDPPPPDCYCRGEGCGEVECRLLYPTQPPLTKGRRKLRVRASSPFVNNPGMRAYSDDAGLG